MNHHQVGKEIRSHATRLGATATIDPKPAPISCIDSFIGRAQEHNEMLIRLIQRTQCVADRMFGNLPEEEDGSGSAGPNNLLGVLETQLMVSEQLATKLLEQISRLEVL